jgi:steroid delta-isomerase-like uncharacterized protein
VTTDRSTRGPALDDLFDAWQAAWSGRRGEAFQALCVPALHYEDPLTEAPLTTRDALVEHLERLWLAFPDLFVERTGPRLGDGSFASAPCRLAGTNTGPLGTLPATGRAVSLHVVFFCQLRDGGADGSPGRLRRVRAFCDLYRAGVQLGLLPARGTLGARALLALRGFGLRAR